MKKDNLVLGIAMGFIAPVFGLIIIYYLRYYPQNASFPEYLELFKQNKQMLTGTGSLSLMINAVLFTIYINRHLDQTAKGIFVATLIYGITILLLKLVA